MQRQSRCMLVIFLLSCRVFLGSLAEAQDDFGASMYDQVLAKLENLTPGETMVVELGTEKDTFNVGETIEARLRMNADSYIVLMEISPAEGIRFLIPSRQISDNKVKGKRVYSTLYDFKLKLKGTSAPGYEILNLFCSPEKIDLFDAALSEKKPYYTITPKDEEQLRKLLDRLEHLQKQEWSGKSVTVWIVNPKSENFFSIAAPGAMPSTLNKFFPPIGAAGTTGKQ